MDKTKLSLVGLINRIAARDSKIKVKQQHLASNLRESRVGENHDFQANYADEIVDLQKEQSKDIDRLVILIHGGGTGQD